MGRDQQPSASAVASAAALFQGAARDFETGRFAEAERACRRILSAFPDNASTLHLLGLIAYRTGHLADAKTLIARSLAQNPKDADAHNSLGCVLLDEQNPVAALPEFDAALRLRRAYPDAHANRARALLMLGRAEDGVASARNALAARPDHFDAWAHLGNGLLELGRLQEAAEAFAHAVALRPDHPGAHNNLGRTMSEQGRLFRAEEEFRRAVALAPNDPAGYVNLGSTLNDLGQTAEAQPLFEKALELAPNDLRALRGLGGAQMALGRFDAALATHTAALASHPDDIAAHWTLASAYLVTGRRDAAVDTLNAALRLDPNAPAVLATLMDIHEPGPDDPLFARVDHLVASGTLDVTSEILLRFALGRALLKAKEGDRAFAHLDTANRLKRARLTFDIVSTEHAMATIAARFTPDLFSRLAGAGAPSNRPIFVVGMPRSGTTLVEQVLASHPDVWGADELGTMASLVHALPPPGYPEIVGELSPAQIARLGQAYLAETDALAQGRARVVDKMPGNFDFAGLIALALPGARIIFCQRDPVDICLSCYATQFMQVPYSYDLTELGRYWRAHNALMAHWRAVLPSDRFIEVRYEEMVADIEGQSRRLVAFAGLAWDDACLAFHKTARAVRTASVNQVRQPIYNRSVGRSTPFAAHLRPLLQALGTPETSAQK